MASRAYEVSATGAVKVLACEASLFLRVEDLLRAVPESPPEALIHVLYARLANILKQLHANKRLHGDVSPKSACNLHRSDGAHAASARSAKAHGRRLPVRVRTGFARPLPALIHRQNCPYLLPTTALLPQMYW
jgi:hypothetical protein